MSQMRIFVSHNNRDKSLCDALVAALRNAGADVWYDQQNLGAGHLLEVITHELEDRPVFVIILSKSAFASPFVRQEWEMAYQLRQDEPHRVILPVVAQPIDRNDFSGVWLPLATFNRIEAPGYKPFPQTEAIRQTLEHLVLIKTDSGKRLIVEPGLTAEQCSDRGQALYYRKEYGASVLYCEQAVRLQPDNASAWYNLAYSLLSLGRNEEALAACERVLTLRPRHSYAWNLKGYILDGMGRHAEQLFACEKALELKPNLARNWANKAEALVGLRRYKEALEACESGLAITPDSQFAFNAKANVLRLLHRYDEALAIYDALLAARSRTEAADHWSGKANVLHSMGRYHEALAADMCAIALEPNSAPLWVRMVQTLKALNLRRESQEAERHIKDLAS